MYICRYNRCTMYCTNKHTYTIHMYWDDGTLGKQENRRRNLRRLNKHLPPPPLGFPYSAWLLLCSWIRYTYYHRQDGSPTWPDGDFFCVCIYVVSYAGFVYPLPPTSFNSLFHFRQEERPFAGGHLDSGVVRLLSLGVPKNLLCPCGERTFVVEGKTRMYNTIHSSTYIHSIGRGSLHTYLLGDGDSRIRLGSRLPQSFSFPIKLLERVNAIPEHSRCQEERWSPPAHGQLVTHMPAWLPLSRLEARADSTLVFLSAKKDGRRRCIEIPRHSESCFPQGN